MNVRPTRTRPAGFSLLELMLVIAIMGVLMAVVAVNTLGAGEKAKRKATVASMRTIKNALSTYHLDYSTYPPALATLVSARVLDANIKDGWKRDFIYIAPGADGREYELMSAGPDNQAGTPDDVNVWFLDKE